MFVATYRTLETKELQISFIRATSVPDEAVKAKRVALIKEICISFVASVWYVAIHCAVCHLI